MICYIFGKIAALQEILILWIVTCQIYWCYPEVPPDQDLALSLAFSFFLHL
jgi:hypothetical protein